MSINEYDSMLKSGETGGTNNEYYDMLNDQKKETQQNLQSNLYAAKDAAADRQKSVMQLSQQLNMPAEFVERNYDDLQKKSYVENTDYDKIIKETPGFAEFLKNRDNVKLAKDDMDGLFKVDQSAQKYSRKSSKIDFKFEDISPSLQTGWNGLGASSYWMLASYGKMSPDEAAERIAELNKRNQELADKAPTYFKDFQAELQKEGAELDTAKDKFLADFDNIKKQKLLDAVKTMASDSATTVGEFIDYASLFIKRPSGTAYSVFQNLANSAPALALGFGGGKLGAEIGAGTAVIAGQAGPQVATPEEIVTVPVGAATGFTVGFLGGSFLGGAIVEIGSQLNEELTKRGIDMTDAPSIAAAMRNNDLMLNVRARAERKGITTAAIDAAFTLFAGRALTKSGAGVTSKVVAGVKDVAVESTGEVISEFGGQVAREKGDLSKVSIADSIQEGFVSFGQSVGQTAIGAGAKSISAGKRSLYSKETAQATEEIVLDTQKAINAQERVLALQELGDQVKELKHVKDVPGKVKELIDLTAGGENAQNVYFQNDEWDNYWNRKGKSPAKAAEEIIGDGGKSYMESKEHGTPLEIPLGQFVDKTATTEDFDGLIQEARTEPDGMNLKEAREHMQSLPETLKQLADEAMGVQEVAPTEEQASAEAEARTIGQDVTDQLKVAGIGDKEAKTYAKIYESAFNAMAERAGLTPKELYDRYQLRIRGGDQVQQAQPGDQVMNQGDDVAAFEAEETPKIKAFYESQNLMDEYDKNEKSRGGKFLDTDLGRELLPDYIANKAAYNDLTDGPAGEFVAKMYEQKLKKPPTGDVWLMAGGPGSGKSEVLDSTLGPDIDSAELIYDSVSSNAKYAKDRIEKALNSGRPVRMIYVYNPIEQAADWVIKRFEQVGRPVSAQYFVEAHVKALETFLQLAETYKNEPAVHFQVFDNTDKENPNPISVEKLSEKRYTKEGESVEQAIERISPPLLEKLYEVEQKTKLSKSEAIRQRSKSRASQEISGQPQASGAGLASGAQVGQQKNEIKLNQAPNALGFTSKLEQTIIEKMGNSQPVSALRAMLKDIKPEEMKWSGLDEFLKGKEKVSKAEVLDFLRANQLQIVEVTKGGDSKESRRGEFDIYEDDGQWVIKDWAGNEIARDFESEDAAEEYLQEQIDRHANEDGDTKFSKYTLPGGENYREVLLTMPPSSNANELTRELTDAEMSELNKLANTKRTPEQEKRYMYLGTINDGTAAKKAGIDESKLYKSSHFDEKNILAHVRLNDRVDADGKRVLFVEEIQSDWHQAGRKKGYKGDVVGDPESIRKQRVEILKQQTKLEREAVRKAVPDITIKDFSKKEKVDIATGESIRYEDLKIESLKSFKSGSIYKAKRPNYNGKWKWEAYFGNTGKLGPFDTQKEAELALTEFIREQALYDKFDTQYLDADLVSQINELDKQADALSEQITSINQGVPDAPFKKTWHEFALKRIIRMAAEGGYDRVAWTTGEQQAERYDLSKQIKNVEYSVKQQRLMAYDKSDTQVINQVVPESDLSDYIGKEAAEKLVAQPVENGFKALDNADLKVGGEGMKGFYDNILVKAADKLVKKFGSKVGETEINSDKVEYALFNKTTGNPIGGGYSLDSAKEMVKQNSNLEYRKQAGGDKVHSLDITQPLRESAINVGFTLFQEGRGQIRFGSNRQFNIDLLKNADPSTFIHETGHFFLEILGDLAEAEGASKQVKDDYAAVLNWLGVQSRADVKVEQHEQWARGFEAYLMEGKAPSEKLRRAFYRFKVWLISVYRQLVNLNVTLTKDVRNVMGRLLATESEINAAEQSQNMEPLFSDPTAYGMTGKQAEKYMKAREEARMASEEQLTAKLMDGYSREKMKWWKDRAAKVRDEVEPQVNNMPVYKVLSNLQRGTLPDGSALPDGVEAIKLNRDELIRQYGAEFVKNRLPKPYIYAREGGIHHDVVASMYGFESGDDMITQLVNAKPRKEMIDGIVNQRMQAEYPDLLTEDAIEQEALRVVHNEKRAQLLRMELEHLLSNNLPVAKEVVRRTVRRMPSDTVLKDQANKILGGRKVKDLKPHVFLAAEKKAAKDAARALTAGDFDLAYQAKEKELLNHYLYRAAIDAKDDVKNSLNKFKKVWKKDADLAKSRDINLVSAARAVLAEFGLGRSDTTAMEHLEDMRKYDPDAYETMAALVESATEGAVDYKEAKYDDFREMTEAVNSLWEMSKRSKEMLIDGKKMDRELIATELNSQMSELDSGDNKAGYNRAATKWDEFKLGLAGFKSILRRVEQWADAMDLGAASGPFKKYIYNPIAEGTANYRVAKRDIIKKYLEIVKGVEKSITREDIRAPEINYTFSGKQELLGALLHVGNESNLRKLLLGRGWASLNTDGTLNTTRWNAFMSRLFKEGVLVKADMDFVQSVWDLLESVKPQAQRAHFDMYGHYFNEITAKEVVTPVGTYRGGYMPAVADTLLAPDAQIRADKELIEKSNNSFMFPTSGRGFTKSRVEQYTAPLVIDLGMVPRHLDKVLRFVHIEPRVKDVARLLIDRSFRNPLDQFDQSVAGEMLNPWLQRSAQQMVEIPSQGRGWRFLDQGFKTLRRNTGLNIMTANVVNTIQQVTGLSIAALKVKPRFLRNSLWSYIRSPKKYAADVVSKSKFMDTRVTTSVIEVQNQIDDMLLNPSKYEKLRDFAQKHGYYLQAGVQSMVDTIVWGGAYDQAIEGGASEKDAVTQADRAVRATQGSFNAEDVSAFEVGSPMFRMFTMFYSYFNMQANILGTEFNNVVKGLGVKKGAGKLLYIYTFGLMIPAVLSEVLVRASAGDFDDDDDDEYMDDAMSIFFGSQFRTVSAMVPYVGQAGNAAVNVWNAKPYDDRVTTSPAISMIESTVKSPKSVYDAVVEGGSAKKAVRDLLSAVGLITGVPVAPLSKPINYLIDVDSGEAQPTGPFDFTRGMVTGKPGTN